MRKSQYVQNKYNFIICGLIINPRNDQLPVDPIAQLVEHCTYVLCIGHVMYTSQSVPLTQSIRRTLTKQLVLKVLTLYDNIFWCICKAVWFLLCMTKPLNSYYASSHNGENDDHKEEDIVMVVMSRWRFKSNDCKTRQTCFVSCWLRFKSLTIKGSNNLLPSF